MPPNHYQSQAEYRSARTSKPVRRSKPAGPIATGVILVVAALTILLVIDKMGAAFPRQHAPHPMWLHYKEDDRWPGTTGRLVPAPGEHVVTLNTNRESAFHRIELHRGMLDLRKMGDNGRTSFSVPIGTHASVIVTDYTGLMEVRITSGRATGRTGWLATWSLIR